MRVHESLFCPRGCQQTVNGRQAMMKHLRDTHEVERVRCRRMVVAADGALEECGITVEDRKAYGRHTRSHHRTVDDQGRLSLEPDGLLSAFPTLPPQSCIWSGPAQCDYRTTASAGKNNSMRPGTSEVDVLAIDPMLLAADINDSTPQHAECLQPELHESTGNAKYGENSSWVPVDSALDTVQHASPWYMDLAMPHDTTTPGNRTPSKDAQLQLEVLEPV